MPLSSRPRLAIPFLAAGILAAALLASVPSAQEPYLHLNPVIEKLEQGRHVFGVSTADLSLQNARSLAGDPSIDYVYVDMEHNPLRFEQLEQFVAFLVASDKAGIVERGHAQARPPVFARFPPYGPRADAVDREARARHRPDGHPHQQHRDGRAGGEHRADHPSRQLRTSAIPDPPGVRGTVQCPFWGIGRAECRQRADLWPLNPQGDGLLGDDRDAGGRGECRRHRGARGRGLYLGAGATSAVVRRRERRRFPRWRPPSSTSSRSAGRTTSPDGGTVTPGQRRPPHGARLPHLQLRLTAANAAASAVLAAGARRLRVDGSRCHSGG